jgi:hypothetical protein
MPQQTGTSGPRSGATEQLGWVLRKERFLRAMCLVAAYAFGTIFLISVFALGTFALISGLLAGAFLVSLAILWALAKLRASRR